LTAQNKPLTKENQMTASVYEFEHKGKKYKVPAFSEVPVGAIRKARKEKDEAGQAFAIMEEMLGESSPALQAVDTMNTTEFSAWLEGWTQGAPLGESSSSAS
jgi:hypothetical protein